MSSKYKTGENTIAHFVIFSVIGWIDVFSRECYKDIVVNGLKYSQVHKGLLLHAWVIMINHLHLVLSSQTNKIENPVRISKNTQAQK
ncbi:MAG: hypothetical protein ABJA78_16750 [Ferruginibacter sp.]